MASDIDPDIILVTETWCNAGISDAYLSLQGYELKSELRLDRGDTGAGRGGGLVVYAKNDLTVLKLDQAARHSQICKFSVSDVAFYLVYRPPSAPADSITELADIVRNSEKNCIFSETSTCHRLTGRRERQEGERRSFWKRSRTS
jgi:hypothetical protein